MRPPPRHPRAIKSSTKARPSPAGSGATELARPAVPVAAAGLGLRAWQCPLAGARCRAVRGWPLDTNVISELRKLNCDERVKAWADSQPPTSLYLSRGAG